LWFSIRAICRIRVLAYPQFRLEKGQHMETSLTPQLSLQHLRIPLDVAHLFWYYISTYFRFIVFLIPQEESHDGKKKTKGAVGTAQAGTGGHRPADEVKRLSALHPRHLCRNGNHLNFGG
jgi:hypothetical protein